MANKKKTSWDVLRNVKPRDLAKFRDVYEGQRLTLPKKAPMLTMHSRIVLDAVMTVFVFFVFYAVLSTLSMIGLAINGDTGVNSAVDMNGIWGFVAYAFRFTFGKFFWSLVFSSVFFGVMYLILKNNLNAQNALRDTSDLGDYPEDQHIALPEEVMDKFDFFPDVGATSDVQVSSMISHVALSNKGINPVKVARRAEEDILDSQGDVVTYKGDLLRDDNGELSFEVKPMIDVKFMHALYDASGLPRDRSLRKFYDTTDIAYNPGGANRDKLKYETVADLINHDWQLPYYEPQRPAGAYIVDTAPVNTMILAITRAGKGQTVIEPTLDMWTRERKPSNMVINDPKGELLVKFYVRGTVRGFQIVQFNLINAMKTDIYNRAPRLAVKSCHCVLVA